jgi:hypothetical protein
MMSNISGVCMCVCVCVCLLRWVCGCVGVRVSRERCMQTEDTVANLTIQKRRRNAGKEAKTETRQGMRKRSKDIGTTLFLVCVRKR